MNKFLFLIFVGTACYSQSVDYNKIILPAGVQTEDLGEKLVQLAWKNYPANEIQIRNKNIAALDLKSANAEWLNIFSVTGNLNEFTLNPESDQFNRAAFYPKYNLAVGIKLGMFLTIPYDVRKNKEQVAIQEEQINMQKLNIRAMVLKAYNTYLTKEKEYRIFAQAKLDVENSHKLVEQRFKQGQVSFEDYSASLVNFNRSSVDALEAESARNDAKLTLESMIGVRLEDVH